MNKEKQYFVYKVKNRELINLKTNVTYDLSSLENKLLLLLNINEAVDTDSIVKFLYGYKDKYTRNNLYLLKFRFIKKTNINIKTVVNYGLLLKDKVIFV